MTARETPFAKADRLYAAIAPLLTFDGDAVLVPGSTGDIYRVTASGCTCKAAQRGLLCYHVAIVRRWQRQLVAAMGRRLARRYACPSCGNALVGPRRINQSDVCYGCTVCGKEVMEGCISEMLLVRVR